MRTKRSARMSSVGMRLKFERKIQKNTFFWQNHNILTCCHKNHNISCNVWMVQCFWRNKETNAIKLNHLTEHTQVPRLMTSKDFLEGVQVYLWIVFWNVIRKSWGHVSCHASCLYYYITVLEISVATCGRTPHYPFSIIHVLCRIDSNHFLHLLILIRCHQKSPF